MKQMILVVVAVAAVGGAIFFATRGGGSSGEVSGPNREIFFACLNKDCPKGGFVITNGELQNYPMDENGAIKCPDCGSFHTALGVQCIHCGRGMERVGHGSTPEKCPWCGENPAE